MSLRAANESSILSPMSSRRDRTIREPDRKALALLFETYWSPGGWRLDRRIDAADFVFGMQQGLMFEPREPTHDVAITEAIAANASLTPAAVASAFAYSLPSRRLDLRSALGSYAATMRLFEHNFEPWLGSGSGSCAVCGLYRQTIADLSTFNFERFKWGGVRHLNPSYAAFDLGQLRSWYQHVEPVDLSTLDALLTRWRSLGHGARPSDAAAAARGLFGSNDAERRTVVGILSIAGVLQPAHLPSMRDQYVSYGDRSDAHPGGKNDWSYPAFVWNGLDGVSEDAVSFWWPRH